MAKKISSSEIAEDDLFGKIRESAEETISIIDKLSKALTDTAEAVKKSVGGAKFDSTKAIDNFVKSTKQANDLQKQAIKLEQERARATDLRNKAMASQQKTFQEQEKTERERIKTTEAQTKATERAAAAAEREKNALKNVAPAYKELSDRSRLLKNQSKELAAQLINLEREGKKNSREYRDLARSYSEVAKQAQITDAQLKKIDSTVGDNFRNVGNYEGAINKLKAGLGNLGLAFGIGSVVSSATDTIMSFDQAVGDLVSITGASGDDLKYFKEQAVTLGKEVEGGASAVIEGYKIIGSAKPELLKNAEALNEVTKAAITLSQASGMELPDAAKSLTDAMNQFGADASQAQHFIDALANGALEGSAEIPQVTDALLKFGAVSKSANVGIDESVALIEALADKGLKGAEAGTALRNVMLKLSAPDALPLKAKEAIQALGISFKDIADPSKTFSDRLKAMGPILKDKAAMVEVFGTENVVAAQNLLQMTDRIDYLTKKANVYGTSMDQAKARTNTMSHALTQLKGAWDEVILGLSSGEGASKALVGTIKFLAENLGTIVKIIAKAAFAWVTYKTIIKAVQGVNYIMSGGLKDMAKELLNVFKSTKKAAEGAEDMADGMKAAGKTMNAIPWMAIIAAVVELSLALYDVASGAAAAREQQALLDAANQAAEENLTKAADRYRKQFDEKMRQLDLEIRARKANGEDEKKLDQEKLKREKEIAASTQKRIKQEYKLKTDALAETIKQEEFLRNMIKRSAAGGGAVSLSQQDLRNQKEYKAYLQKTGLSKVIEDASDYDAVLQRLIARESRLTTEAVGLSEESKKYQDILEENNVVTQEYTQSVVGATDKTKKHAKAQKEVSTELKQVIDLVKELNDANSEYISTEDSINQYLMKRREMGLKEQYDDELEIQLEYTKKTGQIDKANLEVLIDERAAIMKQAAIEEGESEIANLRRNHAYRMADIRRQLEEEYFLKTHQVGITEEQKAKLKKQYDQQSKEIDQMEVANEKVLQDQILEINLKTQGEISDIDRDAAEQKKDLNKDLLDAQKDYNDQKIKDEEESNKKVLEAAKKHAEDMKNVAQLLTDYLVKQSEKRIAAAEKEIEKATDQRDYYQELAAQGNITAKESLAEQNRIIAEANMKKQQEERRKQRIELANTVFQTYASKVESGSKSPLTDTIRDISLLNQFVASFAPAYKDGTEDTGSSGTGVDGQGGFHAILHPHERVMTKEQNQLVGDMSNEQLASLAASYHAGNIISKDGATQLGNGWNTSAIIKQLESLEKTIKNKPEHSLGVENVVIGAMDIVKQVKEGNTRVYNRYRIRK